MTESPTRQLNRTDPFATPLPTNRLLPDPSVEGVYKWHEVSPSPFCPAVQSGAISQGLVLPPNPLQTGCHSAAQERREVSKKMGRKGVGKGRKTEIIFACNLHLEVRTREI